MQCAHDAGVGAPFVPARSVLLRTLSSRRSVSASWSIGGRAARYPMQTTSPAFPTSSTSSDAVALGEGEQALGFGVVIGACHRSSRCLSVQTGVTSPPGRPATRRARSASPNLSRSPMSRRDGTRDVGEGTNHQPRQRLTQDPAPILVAAQHQPLRAPLPMRPAQLADCRLRLRRDLPRMGMHVMAAIRQARRPLVSVAAQPGMDALAAHPALFGDLGHRNPGQYLQHGPVSGQKQ